VFDAAFGHVFKAELIRAETNGERAPYESSGIRRRAVLAAVEAAVSGAPIRWSRFRRAWWKVADAP